MDYVNITAPQGNSGGWLVSYSTLDSPSKDYGNTTDWVSVGSIMPLTHYFPDNTATSTYYNTDAAFQAKWVKWEQFSLGEGQTGKKLTWGVTVR